MVRYVVAGVGAVGARAARQLHSLTSAPAISTDGGLPGPRSVYEAGPEAQAGPDARASEGAEILVVSSSPPRADEVVASLGAPSRAVGWEEALEAGPSVVILAGAADQAPRAASALDAGAHVVATADSLPDVRRLLELDGTARRAERTVAVGAAFSPGLSCVLARHAAGLLDAVEEIRVAVAGTGGPTCARQRLRALSGPGPEWEGEWAEHAGGSGRELCWFPDPVAAQDCYRGAFPEPLLLAGAFPDAERISSRRAASRQDRLLSRLPVLHRPSPEGALGALRVEVVGRKDGAVESRVLGAIDRPGLAAGAVAALTATWAATGRLARPGAAGLAELVGDSVPFLRALFDRGIRAAAYTG